MLVVFPPIFVADTKIINGYSLVAFFREKAHNARKKTGENLLTFLLQYLD